MKFRPSPLAYLSLVTVTLFATTLACGLTGGTGGTTGGEPAGGEAVSSVDDVKSATIQILAEGSLLQPGGAIPNASWSGSGFIIDPSGIAVTNNHVVTGAARMKVLVGGEDEPRNARVLGVAECSDLAVIDIDGEGYPYLHWYDGDINVGLEFIILVNLSREYESRSI